MTAETRVTIEITPEQLHTLMADFAEYVAASRACDLEAAGLEPPVTDKAASFAAARGWKP